MVNDLKDFLKERIKNPFLAALTFFWFVFNWRILAYILFSSDTIELKIEYYKNYYHWLNFYAYPLLSAIVYVILSTFIFAGIEWLTVKGFLLRRKVYYRKLEGDINAQEKVELAKFKREEARSGYKEQKDLNDKIEKLKKSILEKEDIIKNIEKGNKDLENRLKTIKSQISHDFQYDLRDTKIQNLINNFSNEFINQHGRIIQLLYHDLNGILNEGMKNQIQTLTDLEAGYFQTDSNGRLIDIELFSVGKYMLRRYLYSEGSLKKEQIEFEKINPAAI